MGTGPIVVRRVFCHLKPGAKAPGIKFKDIVKVLGRCKGQGISRTVGVELEKCELVK